MWVPHQAVTPSPFPPVGRVAGARCGGTHGALFCRGPPARISSIPARGDPGTLGAGSPLPPQLGTAAPVSGPARAPRSQQGRSVPRPPRLWPRLTLLELSSCDPTSQRGHGSRALPARWLCGCPSSTQGGQGAAAMRGGRGGPFRHGDRRDGGHGGAHGHRQVRARAGEGSRASGPASAGGRELPSPSPSPHGSGGRQAGERSPSHMVGWRRSRCPGNS